MFFISVMIASLYLVCAIFLDINWINDIASSFGYILAIYLVTFVALIPGFNFVFMFFSLLFTKTNKGCCQKCEEDVTILIPMYNSKKCIKKTLESIRKQKYCGNIYTIVIDDGSTDGSVELLKSMDCSNTTIIECPHKGKAQALNTGLDYVKTRYTITVDSDTVLHPLAIRNIMNKLVCSDKKTAATAGCLFVNNSQKNFITKLQQWDYTLGIFGVKLYQGSYNSTLVAQGAFSAYKTELLKYIGGWQNCVGEDIVLTWELLSKGYETNFADNAIAFTEVPEDYKTLGKQRTRWARGMIEAFKRVNVFSSRKLRFKSRFLMYLNLFFPFIDFAILIFVPLGLILLLMGNPLLISWISLLVIFLGLILCVLIEIKRRNMLKAVECKLEHRSIIAFIFYILLYAFFLAPYCLIGYISELFNCKKKW